VGVLGDGRSSSRRATIAAPSRRRVLASHGAEAVKLDSREHPDEMTRSFTPRSGSTGSYHATAVVGPDMIMCPLSVVAGDPDHNAARAPAGETLDARTGHLPLVRQ
jgi:hypothetical protein